LRAARLPGRIREVKKPAFGMMAGFFPLWAAGGESIFS
jgi:hypothetical protein